MAAANSWVITGMSKQDAEYTLFCFPHAGGGASAFRRWKEDLPGEIDLAWIQLPGRENRIRERPFSSMSELAPKLAEAITASADRPFAFYGHSLGARIAFETARVLRKRSERQPCHLFVGASEAPQLPWRHRILHNMPEPQFIEHMQERYGGMPRQIVDDPELRALFLPTLRADVELLETYLYVPEPPLECAITAFVGTEDSIVERSIMEPWHSQTSRNFRLHLISGDHFFVQSSQGELIRVIAEEMKAREN
jgi:surfactin synthase thioesterase subunit